jgi:SAM-dependent methyltransferase
MITMLPHLVPLLTCPWCRGGDLQLRGPVAANGQIHNGSLSCETCGKVTTIKHGIWRAMGPQHRQRSIAQLTNVWPNALFYESVWRPGALSRFSGRKFPLAEELGELIAALNPQPGSVMVDVACSEGLYARSLAAAGASVFAIEHSVPMLRKVVKRAARQGLPVVAVQAVAQHLPFAAGSTDGVAVGGSMNEIGDRNAAIQEMACVMKPGAHLFSMHLLTGKSAPGRALQASLGPSGIVFATASQWTEAFRAAGLEVRSEHVDAIVARLTCIRTR